MINRKREAVLTAAVLRTMVSYDPDTGVMAWRDGHGGRYGTYAGKEIGALTSEGHRRAELGGERFYVHRLIWLYVHGHWPAEFIDHVNGKRADNRLCNLREATQTQNNMNRRGHPISGAARMGRRWRARIQINGRETHIGMFDTADEARAAYYARARDQHGEFAVMPAGNGGE